MQQLWAAQPAGRRGAALDSLHLGPVVSNSAILARYEECASFSLTLMENKGSFVSGLNTFLSPNHKKTKQALIMTAGCTLAVAYL